MMDVAAASRLLADVPLSPEWPPPPPMSTLHALLLFGGVPIAISVGIALLVLAPSLARGPRYRPAEQWDADVEIFGEAPQVDAVDAASAARQVTAGPADDESDSGGASGRW
ncbi:MAG TPA: hypothetical protein VLK34_05285 [Nocardioidaceae bacterium]|nr:hypothetical protein [Nocardioidaceae bacterium]